MPVSPSAQSCSTVWTYLVEPLPDGLHDAVEVAREQGQAARVEQQAALAARLRARRAGGIAVRELLVLAKGGDVLAREAETVVGDGGRRCGGRGRSMLLLLLLRWALLLRRRALLVCAAAALLL